MVRVKEAGQEVTTRAVGEVWARTEPKTGVYLLLSRHGQSEWNVLILETDLTVGEQVEPIGHVRGISDIWFDMAAKLIA